MARVRNKRVVEERLHSLIGKRVQVKIYFAKLKIEIEGWLFLDKPNHYRIEAAFSTFVFPADKAYRVSVKAKSFWINRKYLTCEKSDD